MRRWSRLTKDRVGIGGIGLISSIALILLFWIFLFVLTHGAQRLSWDFLIGDYHPKILNTRFDESLPNDEFERPVSLPEDVWFSKMWGVGFRDAVDHQGNPVLLVAYVDPDSPFTRLTDKNREGQNAVVETGQTVVKVIFGGNVILYANDGAQTAVRMFDQAEQIKDMITSTAGGGIRGSIWTTLLLIVLTLAIALPFGIFSAVFLHEFASRTHPVVRILRRLIDMLAGMPSIVFGLLGAAVFIPFVSTFTAAKGGNLISGALTLSVIVLPLIISSTEEALSAVPDDFRLSSLALGANKTQTTFKVVLKSAVPGVLAGTLLAIGRIIGESAALIYAIGTAIKDEIFLTERSTSLAVHIWSVMSGEVPDFETASAISLMILFVVLVLSLGVKMIAKKFMVDPSLR